jgi:hypothetical protein
MEREGDPMKGGVSRRGSLAPRRVWLFLLLFAVGAVGLVTTRPASPVGAATTQVFLTPSGRLAPETIVGFISGPPLSVDVRVKDVTYAGGLGDFEFTVTYNASVASVPSVASVTPGPFLGSTGRSVTCTTPVIAPGSVNYSCNTLGSSPNGPLGSGVLATIVFQPAASFGSTNLTFATSHLQDITGDTQIIHDALTSAAPSGGMLIAKCGDFSTPPDNVVTIGDILQMILHFGSNAGPPPTANWDPRFDVNPGVPGIPAVNIGDLVIEVQEFGRACVA